MAIAITPYLMFPGNASDALTFYQSVFGGELSILTYAEGMGADDETKDLVMHGSLYLDRGLHLMASDLPAGVENNGLGTVSVSVSESDDTENGTIEGWWEQLTEGAEVIEALAVAPWGDKFGILRDTFGVEWMLNTAEAPQEAS